MSDLKISTGQIDLKVRRKKRAANPEGIDASANEGAVAVEKRPIFLALQGGGARGIVHVGALTAINELNLEIRGVAGTSAGSIMATLIAAGYTGADLLDPNLSEPKHLFNRMPIGTKAKKPTDLFSGAGWSWLRLIRWLPTAHRLKLTYILGLALISGLAYLNYLAMAASVWLGLLANLLLVFIAVRVVRQISDGLTTLDHVREFVNVALKSKLGWELQSEGDEQRDVTFDDLRRARKIPLKIIATNTSAESVEVFCADNTPNVAIADAVAASICLPVIFQPWTITFKRSREKGKTVTQQFLDGGFVSNLPAWPFDEERLLAPEISTIALSIVTPGAESKHWTSSIINTVVNGTAEIDIRAVGRFAKIPLSTKWGMLDFDKDFDAVYIEALRAKQVTVAQLSTELIDVPKALRSAAHSILVDITKIMEEFRGVLHYEIDLKGKIRVAVAAQRSNSNRLLSLVSTSGYPRDIGFGDVLPDGHPSGVAWRKKQLRMAKVESHHRVFRVNSIDAKWVICVPLLPKSDCQKVLEKPCVIMIELDFPLYYEIPSGREHLRDLGACVTDLVNDYNQSEGIANFVQGSNSCI